MYGIENKKHLGGYIINLTNHGLSIKYKVFQ